VEIVSLAAASCVRSHSTLSSTLTSAKEAKVEMEGKDFKKSLTLSNFPCYGTKLFTGNFHFSNFENKVQQKHMQKK
jgi:hypothetical protein